MLDDQLVHHVKRHGDLYDAVALMSRKTSCGAVKELAYSQYDNCFYVTVNGREKFRGDSPQTVYGYFCSTTPSPDF